MKNLIIAVAVSLLYTQGVVAKESNATVNKFKPTLNLQLDPVYQLDVKKYPKFATKMVLKSGKELNFVSVKAMLNYYYHPEKYPGYGAKSRADVDKMFVKDYLSGKEIKLQDAWFVFGSRLVGPHGDDLIPLSSKTTAELFVSKYGGTKILSFQEVANKGFGLIKYLDM